MPEKLPSVSYPVARILYDVYARIQGEMAPELIGHYVRREASIRISRLKREARIVPTSVLRLEQMSDEEIAALRAAQLEMARLRAEDQRRRFDRVPFPL